MSELLKKHQKKEIRELIITIQKKICTILSKASLHLIIESMPL